MEALLPWLTLAGLGALHGLSPANGWMFAAARGLRLRDAAQARRTLMPIALGHAASIVIVVAAVAQGILMDRAQVQAVAGALLVGLAAWRALRGPDARRRDEARPSREPADRAHRRDDAGIALWSCLMTTTHGAGLMLLPALVPLCMSATPAREITASGSLILGLLAVAVHLAAMLATTGAIAAGVCRGAARFPRIVQGGAFHAAWTLTLAATGIALLALR